MVRIADGSFITVREMGNVSFYLNGNLITLHDCYHVPSLTCNLFSVTAATRAGCSITFSSNKCNIRKGDSIIASPTTQSKTFWICSDDTQQPTTVADMAQRADTSLALWHQRLGHLNTSGIVTLMKQECGINLTNDIEHTCEACALGKITAKPVRKERESPLKDKPLAKVHTDIIGPISPTTRSGLKYLATFTDDCTRYITVAGLKEKSALTAAFKEYQRQAETQTGHKIREVVSDNGGEYTGQQFQDHLKECGITHLRTAPDTPQQDGVSERDGRTIMEITRTCLLAANTPKQLWFYAAKVAAHTKNLVRHRFRCHAAKLLHRAPSVF